MPDDVILDRPTATQPTRLAVRVNEGVTHVTFPSGRVDGNAVRELYEVAAVRVNSAAVRFLVDFSGVDMANSGAMGMMVTLKKRCMSEGAQFHIAIPDANVRRQFQLMNLHLILNIFPTTPEAVEKFKA